MPRHARVTRLIGVALLVALAAIACRRASGPPPERYVSARAAAVVIPELRRAGRELATLHQTISSFPGAAQQLAGLRDALTAQLGFDVLDPEALARAGIEPARGAALAREPSADGAPATPVLILPVRDAGALEDLVARLARERLGAPQRSESTEGAMRVVTFRPSAGAPAALSLALLAGERTAALAPGPGGAAAAALSRPAPDSLAESAAWRELRKTLGDRYAMILGGVPPAPDLPPPGREGLAVGLSAGAGVLRVGVASRLGAATDLRALRAGGDARSGVRSLSPEAALVLRWDGDPGALGKHLLARVPAGDRAWLSEHGFDLQRDLFDCLAPGVAASVSISPRLDLTDLSDVALRADPLRLVRFELVADVRDEAAAHASLARLPALFAALQRAGGTAAVPAAAGAARVLTPSGEIAWRLDGKRLLLTGGPPGALEALRARQGASSGYAAPTKTAAAALQGGLAGAVLNPRSLVQSVRALPEDSFGTGPAGFVIRSVIERFLEPAEQVRAVSMRAELTDVALVVEVELEAPAGDGKGKR